MRRCLTLFAALLAATSTAALAGPHMRGGTPGQDPPGVIALGLQSVYHSKETNGARTATTNVSVYPNLPAGFSYNAASLNSDITAGTAVSAIDNALKGGFYFSGNQTSTLTDFTLTSNSAVTGGGLPLATGETSGGGVTGATNFDGEHCTIDGAGMLASGTTMIQPHGAGTFKLAFCNLLHPARDQLVTDGAGGAYIIDNDYFDSYCQNTGGGDHCEWLHIQGGGASTVTNNFFNAADGVTTGGNSGAFQIQTGLGVDPRTYTGGPITATFTNNIINYGCILNQSTWSLKAVFDDITVNIGSNVWCVAATAPTTGIVKQADIKVTSVIGTWTAGVALVSGTGGKSNAEQGGVTGGNNLHMLSWGSGGNFAPGDVLVDQTSGAQATVVSVSYHNVTVNNLGSNLNFIAGSVTP